MKAITTFFIIIFTATASYGQSSGRTFSDIAQTYYLNMDKDVVDKTIDFVNNAPMSYKRIAPIITGFCGALFLSDSTVKKSFLKNIDNINDPDIKRLINSLSTSNLDSIYSNANITPDYNDMNWSSFFATGNLKYLDNIIANVAYADNRTDIQLFFNGIFSKVVALFKCNTGQTGKKASHFFTRKKHAYKRSIRKRPAIFQN